MKFLLLVAIVSIASAELYHYQECARGTTVLLKEPCQPNTYEGNSPYHPLADNKFAITCTNTKFSFVCQDETRHVFQLRARSISPRLFASPKHHSDDFTPVILIIVTLLFVIYCCMKRQ
ncbi:ORF7a protein [Bat coronavirus BM48-31/BGR/2008]|uniref:ORF7a protein n=1 Tax=Bat coronavirus BM48-31/BGR/2008 TaxID=864596 RepID=UPI0001E13BE7|nr:ORF7a protein [Bat coronavirus BM48-31/BGR/2008]ADK66846.1 ORF7a [Bat coronavirus BM48-31/BGR/2008]